MHWFVQTIFLWSILTCNAMGQDQDPSADLADLANLGDLQRMLDEPLLGRHHIHKKGDWMAGYKFVHMAMTQQRSGTTVLNPQEVLGQDYMVSPVSMNMSMHMIHLMYGVSDRVTLMVMPMFMVKEMDHLTAMGGEFSVATAGAGDLKLRMNLVVVGGGGHSLLFLPEVSFPLGSIDERGSTPMGEDEKLPYPMQLGTGSFGVRAGVAYVGHVGVATWNLQFVPSIQLNKNDLGYRWGNEYRTGAELAIQPVNWLVPFVRVEHSLREGISGQDTELNPAMAPTADPSKRQGQRVDVLGGVTILLPPGPLVGVQVTLEGGGAVWQDLTGPQLGRDFQLSAEVDAVWRF